MAIEKLVQCLRCDIALDLLWSPHKMTYDGTAFNMSAAGSNERTDILLVATSRSTGLACIVATVYHTTNAVSGTYSGRQSVINMECRILVKQRVCLRGSVAAAARQRAIEHARYRGFGAVLLAAPPIPEMITSLDEVSSSSTSSEASAEEDDEFAVDYSA